MIRKYGLYATWVIAMLATFGSLYLNEVQAVLPCYLCWYQKICMYPIAIIAGLAAWRGNLGIAVYLLPQTVIGLVLAIFQMIKSLSLRGFFPIQFCTPGSDGKETIAFDIESLSLAILSFIAFFFVNCLLFAIHYTAKKDSSYEK